MAVGDDNMAGRTAPRMDVRSEVRAFITRSLSREVPDSENFFQTGIASSLFGLQLITFIEKAFELHVTDEDLDMENFMSVEKITRFVARKKREP